ncbi:MAG: replicative DNA helicase [Crinalium sp.]
MIEQLPPQNVEVETTILGGILFDPKAIGRIADILPAQAFYVPAYQKIYSAALALYHQDKPTDLMTVSNWLEDHKQLEHVGGMPQLVNLIEKTVSAANIDRYAAIVVDKYIRRQLMTTGYEIVELGIDTTIDLESVLQQSEEKIFNLTVSKQDQFEPQLINDCLTAVFHQLEQGQTPSYSTGLTELDALTGGLFRKDLIIIAARASMGKTWLACYLANHIAVEQKLPVVFFSAEMSKEQLTKRFLAMHSNIDSNRLMRNIIYEEEFNNLAKAVEVIAELLIIIDDTPASIQNPSKIRSVLRRIKAKHGQIGLVVMDYIQKLGDRGAGNRAQVVGKFSGAFKDIAKEFDVPFIALAQINRGVESQSNKRPFMSDIKDSGDIEQDADQLLLLYRDEYYYPDTQDTGVMEINIGKNRSGAIGICKVQFNPMIGKFYNRQSS